MPAQTGGSARALGALAAGRVELRDDVGAITEAQWKWLLRGRLKALDNLAELFRHRQPPIAVLDAQIVATDRLIDQIVYALYGLSVDETALVEGGAL